MEALSVSIVSLDVLAGLKRKSGKQTRGNLTRQFIASSIVGTYNILLGISLAYSAILIPQLSKNSSDIATTVNESPWIASVLTLSMPITSPLGAILMDMVGRLNTVKIACLPSVIGWTIIAVSTSFSTLILGRIVTGIASVLGTAPAIVYITEIARSDMRGSFICLCTFLCSTGMVMAYIEGWMLSWRLTAWLSVLYSTISLIALLFLPESPAWLITKDKHEKALKALHWFHNTKPNATGELGRHSADLEFANMKLAEDIKKSQQQKKQGLMRIIIGFSKPTGYKPFLILFGLFTIQQFSGVYITLFYSVEFFEETGTIINPYLCSIFIGLVRAIMSVANVYILKTFRKRPLLIWSCIGMFVCMLVSGFFTLWIQNGTTTLTWVPVMTILLYVFFSIFGMLSIPWTMTAELFPMEIRAVAHSCLYSTTYISMFFSVQYYEDLKQLCRGIAGIQWFFSAVSLIGAVYTLLLLPETHDCELSEIEDYFKCNMFYLCRNKVRGIPEAVFERRSSSTLVSFL